MIRRRLVAVVLVLTAPAARADDPTDFHLLRFWLPATAPEYPLANVVVTNVDQDPQEEILSVSRYSWQIHEQHETELRQVWSSLPEVSRLTCVRAVPAAWGPVELVVSVGDLLRIYDSATKSLLRTIESSAEEVLSFTVAELTPSSPPRIFICDQNDLFVHDYATGSFQEVKWGFGCTGLDVGQIDEDPQLELLLAGNGLAGLVLDGASLEVNWADLDGFGRDAFFLQADGDARDEIFAPGAAFPDVARALDPESSSLLWDLVKWPFGLPSAATDLDGDGRQEVLLGSIEGDLFAFDAHSGAELGIVDRPLAQVRAVTAGDTDGDSLTEAVWYSYYERVHSNQGALTVANSVGGTTYASTPAMGAIQGLAGGDFTGAARLTIVGVDDDSYVHRPASIRAYDVATGQLLWTTDVPGERSVADATTTPTSIYCAAGGNGLVTCLDAETGLVEWEVQLPRPATSVELGDVAGDSRPEVVVGTSGDDKGTGPSVYALSVDAGELVWQSPPVNHPQLGSMPLLRIGNVDDDSPVEVVVMNYDVGATAVFDGTSGKLEYGPHVLGYSLGIDLAQLDADPELDVAVLSASGLVQRVDPRTGATETPMANLPPMTLAFRVADVTRDGQVDLVFSHDRYLAVWSLSLAEEIWRSPDLGDTIGDVRDDLIVTDADSNGVPEITVVKSGGFATYEAPLESLFQDGFESGDLSAWTFVLP